MCGFHRSTNHPPSELHAEATPTRLVFIGRAGCQVPWRMQSGKSPWIGVDLALDLGHGGGGHMVVSRALCCHMERTAEEEGPLGDWAGMALLLIDLKTKAPRLSPPWMEQFGRTMQHAYMPSPAAD
ncbi:hypothetical protein GQ55_9G597200 [Panicum hallii var. hallii]|uniref:Uncharacterized protein n=1 Tax=Panicum hallii var. hallii TaxID=1504633 RepID=A0A2T7CH20_9POAL|nr:hypothetical protein GQ55_9G597200 [Panicum hallii var. hallii]